MTLNDLAKEYYEAFEQRTRDNGNTFYCFKDDAAGWIDESVSYVHGTDITPNDWRYSMMHSIAGSLADQDSEGWEDRLTEIAESCIDVYNHDLLKWAMSDLSRAHEADEIANEYGGEAGIYQRLQFAQSREAEAIAYRLIETLREQLED